MVIAKIGNPIIPDTSDASRAQYERLKKLSDEYGVDVILFPAKGTQVYNDWYTNFPRTIVIRLWLIGWTHSTKEHRRQLACVL